MAFSSGPAPSDSLLIDLLEDVFEASVVALQDGVLGAVSSSEGSGSHQHAAQHQ